MPKSIRQEMQQIFLCQDLRLYVLVLVLVLLSILATTPPPMETLSLMQSMMSRQPTHQYVKTYIGMVREELASAVRCPY